jgi:hypothetical protein
MVHNEQIQFIFVYKQHRDMRHQNNNSQTEHLYTLCLNKTSLSDGDAIGGGLSFKNESPPRLDRHTSVPVPVPILQNINFVQQIYTKSIKQSDEIARLSADPVPTDHKSYKIITGMTTGVPGLAR